jgi:hypothetical protein
MKLDEIFIGDVRIGWNRATHRVFCCIEDDLLGKVMPTLKQTITQYACENQVPLIASTARKITFANHEFTLENFLRYIDDTHPINAFIFLIEPECVMDENKARVLLALWKRSRILAFPAFSICPMHVDNFFLKRFKDGAFTECWFFSSKTPLPPGLWAENGYSQVITGSFCAGVNMACIMYFPGNT